MIVWLLVLLAIVALGVLLWRSERHNQQIHGKGSGVAAERAEQARHRDEGRGAVS